MLAAHWAFFQMNNTTLKRNIILKFWKIYGLNSLRKLKCLQKVFFSLSEDFQDASCHPWDKSFAALEVDLAEPLDVGHFSNVS